MPKSKRIEQNSMLYYAEVISLYQGDFDKNNLGGNCALSLSTYYHSLFLTAVKSLLKCYEEKEAFEEMEGLCKKALENDPEDEEIHGTLVISLIRQNKQKLAEEHYKKAIKVLYDTLGVQNSSYMKKIQEELLKMNRCSNMAFIDEICGEMEEREEVEEAEGAYICGYTIFKEIFHLEVRRIERLGIKEYVLLITLAVKPKLIKNNPSAENFMMKRGMAQLEDILHEALRKGDIATRCSDTQFIILLSICTYEGSIMITQRVMQKFRERKASKWISAKGEIREVKAIETIVNENAVTKA